MGGIRRDSKGGEETTRRPVTPTPEGSAPVVPPKQDLSEEAVVYDPEAAARAREEGQAARRNKEYQEQKAFKQTMREVGEAIDDAYKALPAQQNYYPSPENINWLGSSYTGSDIKVIAHLYKPSNAPADRLAKLNQDLLYSKRVKEACTKLLADFAKIASNLAATDPWELRRDVFIAASGLDPMGDEVEQRAVTTITSAIYQSNFKTVTGIALMRRRLENLKQASQMEEQGLQSAVDSIEQLLAEGGAGQQTVVLATLQTITLQTHREKFAVRALGHSYVKGYCRGPRTIAGSMIFTVFNEHALSELQRAMGDRKEFRDPNLSTYLPDQLPPIDLTLVFANEYGNLSELRMYGVEFVNDGITFSIEDLLSENVINFVARDCDVLTDKGKVKLSRLQRGILDFENPDDSASSLLGDEAYNRYLDRIGARRRLKNR